MTLKVEKNAGLIWEKEYSASMVQSDFEPLYRNRL